MRFALGFCLIALATSPGLAGPPSPERHRLQTHIGTLASPEFGGRRGAAAERSRSYLIDQFKKLGLTPLFGSSFLQPVPGTDPKHIAGQNVGAILRGSDPTLRDEWVIVAAHYDHLGKHGEVLYPGADDNASGVAMMLEVARCLATNEVKPKRSLMFIGFDLEEAGLWGSRYFAEHSPIPLSKVKLFVTADMIGRSLGGVFPKHVFVMGSEHIPAVRPVLDKAGLGLPLKVGTLGADVLLLDRSDYGPFRARKVPFLFFSTGENPHYHQPTDIPETIDYEKVESVSRLIHGVVADAAVRETCVAWTDLPNHPLAEALVLRDVFRGILENREALRCSSCGTRYATSMG
jgi:hypothetical protein